MVPFRADRRGRSVELTGNSEALANALPKIAQLNVIGWYWRRLEQRLFPNGSAIDLQLAPAVFPTPEEGALVGANARETRD